MLCVLLILLLFSPSPVSSETLGSVEYHFPTDGQEWVEGNRIEGHEGATVIYVPKGETRHSAGEFTTVSINQYPIDVEEPLAVLYDVLKNQFPYKDITIRILEKDSNSVLYEWAASQSGILSVVGWGRGFTLPERSVLITYQTRDVTHFDSLRRKWIDVLRDASITDI